MSEALYYSQPRLTCHEAPLEAVLPASPEEALGGPGLVFDSTIFYPEGGGQPGDLGTIGGQALARVVEEGGRVVHYLASPLPPGFVPGATLAMSLDGGRRQDHTEQHSGQHLLSATFLRLLGAPTRSFHLGPERSTIDLAMTLPGPETLAEIEAEVNNCIAENYLVRTHLCPPEDPSSFPLRRLPPPGAEVLRIVEIDGLDYTPCCGTHVGSTGELRLLLVLGAEKYKGDLVRVHFVVGGRAVALASQATRAAREASRTLGVGLEALEPEVAKTLERQKRTQGERRLLVRERARLEAKIGHSSLGPGQAALVYLPGRDVEAALEGSKAYAELGHPALLVLPDEMIICAAAPEKSLDLGALLGPLAEEFEARGGGNSTFFRATFQNSDKLAEFLVKAMKSLQN